MHYIFRHPYPFKWDPRWLLSNIICNPFVWGQQKGFQVNPQAIDNMDGDSVFSPNGDGVQDKLLIVLTMDGTTGEYRIIIDVHSPGGVGQPDGNFEPEEIPKFAELAKQGYYDQVIVSRFAKTSVNEDAGFFDAFGNKMFTFLTNIFFGGYLTDSLNGSRMISKKALEEINFRDEGKNFAGVTQMTARSLKLGHKICNLDGNERERVGGVRKMRPFQVGATLSWEIIKNFIFWKV